VSTTPESHSRYWYDVVKDVTLRQGDIFRDIYCYWPSRELDPLRPPTPEEKRPFEYDRGDFIICSASCDVAQGTYPFVILAQIYEATEEILKARGKDFVAKLEVVRDGLVPALFLLSDFEGIEPRFPLSVVQYRRHALMPIEYLRKCCTNPRLRLLHPIRERFGNWVGANISRVGPEDTALIPSFGKIFPAHVVRANAQERE
jgi:hypothetical protein